MFLPVRVHFGTNTASRAARVASARKFPACPIVMKVKRTDNWKPSIRRRRSRRNVVSRAQFYCRQAYSRLKAPADEHEF